MSKYMEYGNSLCEKIANLKNEMNNPSLGWGVRDRLMDQLVELEGELVEHMVSDTSMTLEEEHMVTEMDEFIF